MTDSTRLTEDSQEETAPLGVWKAAVRDAVLEAGKAAEEFRGDFKTFLSQLSDPISWKDSLKLVVNGGWGLLKDLQEMVCSNKWSLEQLVKHMDTSINALVEKHPELTGEWDKVKISFNFAKLKTNEAMTQMKARIDQNKISQAIWSGIKGEIKEDIVQIMARFKAKKDL